MLISGTHLQAHLLYCMMVDYKEGMNQLQISVPVSKALNNLLVFFTVFNIVKNAGDFLEVRLTISF